MFHNLGDVDAVVKGSWKGLFSLLDVFFINVEFLDTGVFPDVVFELRFETKGEGGVDGGVLLLEGTVLGILYAEIPLCSFQISFIMLGQLIEMS